MSTNERQQAVNIDIDTRLMETWLDLTEPGGMLKEALGDTEDNTLLWEFLGANFRAAYVRGYCDALREDREGFRSILTITHGYKAE